MNSLLDKGIQIIAHRAIWERKQRLYYQMRHDGLRRINKPGPWAADQHLPLVDMNIGDLKPFWSAQVFGGDRLCDFVAMRQQLSDTTESAADFHSFELRHRSNYRLQMERAIDTMLLRGRGVLLITTDPFKDHEIKCKSIDPLWILMAEQFDDFDDADYWIHVQRLTVAQYKRNKNFIQDPEVLNSIRGKKDFTFNAIELDKQIREGITHSTNEDEVVLWNLWERTPGGFTIRTYSPMAPDKMVRRPYGCPYKDGKEASNPFKSITMEVKDEGWYAPRGIAELNAQFEAYACTLWNNKTDAMKFGNTPLFTSDGEIKNAANIRFGPGDFIPGGVRAVEMPQPAYSFDQEINFARGLSEQRAKVPDFGIADDSAVGGNKPRTATENNRIASMQSVGADYNGEVFRDTRLAKIYKHTWALMLQFQRAKLSYFVAGDLKELPQQALHDEYLVLPTGGTADKTAKKQEAGGMFAAFKGAPNIDQDELARIVIEAGDSRLVRRLLIPTNQKAQSEAYQEAVNIAVLNEGYPVPVLPNEDHATRIMVLVGYLHKQMVTGAHPDPIAVQRIQQHLAEHFSVLKQIQPQAARALLMQIQQMEAAAAQSNASPAAAAPQMPGNVSPMPGQPQTGTQATEEKKGPAESISMKLADFYPSERAQILAGMGVRAASPQEMLQTEQARAQIKQAGVKPKIEGAVEA